MALLIKDNLIFKEIKFNNGLEKMEIVGAEVNIGKKNITVISLYIPPGENKMNPALLNYLDTVGDYILVGDLNAKIGLFEPTNHKRLRVGKGMVANSVNNPIFHKYKLIESNRVLKREKVYESTIDFVITSDSISQMIEKVESLTISAAIDDELLWFHTPLLYTFEIKLSKKKSRPSFHSFFLYDRAKWKDFEEHIDKKCSNFSESTNATTNEMSKNLTESIQEAASKFIPKSKEKLTRSQNFPQKLLNV